MFRITGSYNKLQYCRIAVCMAYFGLALNSDKLGSQSGVHLYFFLQALMDVPASLLVVLLIDRTGRKPMLVGCLLIGGLACIATIFTTVFGGKGIFTVGHRYLEYS